MDYGITESEEPKLSKINSAALINLRLNQLWNDCHKHSRSGMYFKWNDDLDRIWCELAGDVPEKDKKETKFNDLNLRVSKTAPKKTKKGFEEFGEDIKLEITEHRQALIKKEIFLRRLMNEQGKGTAYVGDEDEWE